jgi:hypothetical protein
VINAHLIGGHDLIAWVGRHGSFTSERAQLSVLNNPVDIGLYENRA